MRCLAAPAYRPLIHLQNSLHLSSADPELVRQAAITNFQHLQDRSMFQICPGMAIEAEFMNKGLFASQ